MVLLFSDSLGESTLESRGMVIMRNFTFLIVIEILKKIY